MTCTALEHFEEEHNFKFKKITRIPLEGDGTVERKVEKYVCQHRHGLPTRLTSDSGCIRISSPMIAGWKTSTLQMSSLWQRTRKAASLQRIFWTD